MENQQKKIEHLEQMNEYRKETIRLLEWKVGVLEKELGRERIPYVKKGNQVFLN